MYFVGASDILPLDICIDVRRRDRFMDIVREYKGDPDGKTPITFHQFRQMSRELFDDPDLRVPSRKLLEVVEGNAKAIHETPGGSSYTTVRTAARMGLGAEFFGVTGDDRMGDTVRKSFETAGYQQSSIRLRPDALPTHPVPLTSVSFRITHRENDGNLFTSYFVYRGNARDMIAPGSPATLQLRDMVGRMNGFFWQASQIDKFDPNISHFDILGHGWNLSKDVFIAPHTSKDAVKTADHMRYIFPSASAYFGSAKEWTRTLLPQIPVTDDVNLDPWPVLKELQLMSQSGFLARVGRESLGQQTGYISHGKAGVFAVTPDEIIHAPAGQVAKIECVGSCGDTLAGVLLATHVVGVPLATGLRIGTEITAAKIETTMNACLRDPLKELERRDASLYRAYNDALTSRLQPAA